MAENIEKLENDFQELSIEVKVKFSLCSWNINGEAVAECRKQVLKDTFERVLPHCKIVCLQEVPFDPKPGGTMQQYIPQVSSGYGVIQAKEGDNNIYNAVLFQEEKFEDRSEDERFTTAIENAFFKMEEKRKVYRYFSSLDDETRTREIERRSHEEMKNEVCTECSEYGFNVAAARFHLETLRPLKSILKDRVAFSFLQAKVPGDCFFIVMSVHFPRKEKDANDFAYLLFDFLARVRLGWPIIIAGDFNFDIASHNHQNLRKFFGNYSNPDYALKQLRNKRIDYIMCKKSTWLAVTNVSAHDFIVRPETEQKLKGDDPISKLRTVTNHNPLTADLTMRVRIKTKPPC